MTDPVGRGAYELSADRTQLKQDLTAAEGDVKQSGAVAEQAATQSLGKLKNLSGPAMTAIAGVAAHLVNAGGAALQMGRDYTAASNTLIERTGASGAKLAALQQTMRNVAGQVPEGLNTVADAVGLVNVRLGLTGPALDTATKKFLDFARVNHIDVTDAIDSVSAAMEREQIPASQLPEFLDKLQVAHERTGITVESLTSSLAAVGPTLTDMGYSIDQSIALISAWNKAGGDSSQLAAAMNKAYAAFSKQGAKDGADALDMLIAKVKAAGTEEQATAITTAIFGKSGVVMAQQIRDGTFDIDSLTAAVQNAGPALDNVTESTKTLEDRTKEFFNGIAAQVGPFTAQMSDIGNAASNFSSLGSAAKTVGTYLIDMYKNLPGKVAPVAAAAGTAVGEAEGEGAAAGSTGSKVLNSFLTKFGIMKAKKVVAAEASGLEQGAAEGEAEAEGATATGMVDKWAAKFAAMTGGKIIAAQTAGTAEGAAEGLAAAEALGGEDVLAAAGESGTAAGAAFASGAITGLGTLGLALLGKLGTDALTNAEGDKNPANAWLSNSVLSPGSAAHKTAVTNATTAGTEIGTAGGEAAGFSFGASSAPHFKQAGTDSVTFFSDGFTHDSRWHTTVETVAQSVADDMRESKGLAGVTTLWTDATNKGIITAADDLRESHSLAGSATVVAQEAADALAARDIWNNSAQAIGGDIVAAIKGVKPGIKSAMDDLTWAIQHPLAEERKKARIEAALTSDELQTALASKNPEIRTKAEQTEAYLEGLYEQLTGVAYTTGTDVSKGISQIDSTYPVIIDHTRTFVSNFNDILNSIETNKHVNVTVATGIAGKVSHIPLFAAGGHYNAGDIAIVGDAGRPELFQADRSGTIFPRVDQSAIDAAIGGAALGRGAVAGGGSAAASSTFTVNGGVNVTVNGGVTNAETAGIVSDAVYDVFKKIGRARLTATVDMSGVPG